MEPEEIQEILAAHGAPHQPELVPLSPIFTGKWSRFLRMYEIQEILAAHGAPPQAYHQPEPGPFPSIRTPSITSWAYPDDQNAYLDGGFR